MCNLHSANAQCSSAYLALGSIPSMSGNSSYASKTSYSSKNYLGISNPINNYSISNRIYS